MARKAKNKSNVVPIDLGKVNPSGRFDVIAARALDLLANRVPELVPVLNEHKGVIHASLNEQLGPHVLSVDLPAIMNQIQPYLPILGMIALHAMSASSPVEPVQAKQADEKTGGGNAA